MPRSHAVKQFQIIRSLYLKLYSQFSCILYVNWFKSYLSFFSALNVILNYLIYIPAFLVSLYFLNAFYYGRVNTRPLDIH